MRRIQADWGIIGWTVTILAVIALLAVFCIATFAASDDCTSRGGHEVFQYFVPSGKGTLVPIYACEGAHG